MKRTFPIWRTIAALLACALVVVGVNALITSHRIEKRVEQMSNTRPLDMKVDLSEPGTHSAPLNQTWDACHGQRIDLHLAQVQTEGASAEELLGSLKFSWQITDVNGEILAEHESWTYKPDQHTLRDGIIPIAHFHPFAPGEYRFTCEVIVGAPALADVDQAVVSEYMPCGLELLPALAAKLVGFPALFFGGIIALWITLATVTQFRGA